MPFTVTQRKRGGFEFTSVAETQSAALVLAQMMRRAGDEYSAESMVTVRDGAGVVLSAWRGGNFGWQPLPQSRPPLPTPGLQPLSAPPPPPTPRATSRFARLPTEPMQSSPSLSRSYASVSITEYSAV
jgi:hypothetical protein